MKTIINRNLKKDQSRSIKKTKFSAGLLVALFALLLSTNSFAKTSLNESKSKEKVTTEIRKQLNEQIKFPEFIKSGNTKNESVNVLFQVKSDGSVMVVKADGPNENLNTFIEQEFRKAKIESVQVNDSELYKINIHFKLL